MPVCFDFFNFNDSQWECRPPISSDAPILVNLSLGIPTSTSTTDYSSGVIRSSTTEYAWQAGLTGYLSANILDEPYISTVSDGQNHPAAKTTVTSDQAGNPTQTSVSRWNNVGTAVVTTTYRTSDGMVDHTVDANGNTVAQYTYGSSPCQRLFPSSVKDADNQTTQYTWDCNTGKVASVTDPNGVQTNYSYDQMGRVTTVQNAVGTSAASTTTYAYSPSIGSATTTISESRDQIVLNDQKIKWSAVLDGLGRQIHQYLPNDSTVDTTYDGLDRVISQTNPYFSKNDPTFGYTTFSYDALGRKTMQCQPDNGTGSGPCVAGSSYLQWSYTGNTTSSEDENGNWWTRASDALGRLTSVVEPGGLLTTYAYDPLGNLQCADQWGVATAASTACTSSHSRSFTYDSLSRLLCASNPETSSAACPGSATASYTAGTTGYTYDPNGNLLTKISPLANQPSGTPQTINYSYDLLNRLTQKGYPVLPAASKYSYSCYQYDATSNSSATSPNYFVGRLTNSWTQISTASPSSFTCPSSPPSGVLSRRSILAYDPMGRPLSEQQCTAASCGSIVYTPSYTYNLAGSLSTHSSGIPNGTGSFTFTNGYDSAGHLTSVTSSNTLYPTTLFTVPSSSAAAGCSASSLGYSPAGGLQNAILGVGLQLTRSYDSRLRINCETDIGNSVVNPTPGTAKIVINGTEQP
jgi:YD repeat-containing protein